MDWTRHVPRSCLRAADDAAWRRERGYSSELAGALMSAHASLTHLQPRSAPCSVFPSQGLPSLPSIRDQLRWCRAQARESHQRLIALYLSAQAAAASGAFYDAVNHLDWAMELARDLHAAPARVELAWRAGAVSTLLDHYADACVYYDDALASLIQRGVAHAPLVDVAPRAERAGESNIELDLLIGLAVGNFQLARFDEAQRYLGQATGIRVTRLPTSRSHASSIHWMEALVERWRGNLIPALDKALQAVTDLDLEDERAESTSSANPVNPINRGRGRLVVVDIALDLAERGTRDALRVDRQSCLKTALSYLAPATRLLGAARDRIGAAMVQLAASRFDLIAWGPAPAEAITNRSIVSIRRILDEAERMEDIAIVGRARTALGDAYAARGECALALGQYAEAKHRLERFDLQALAILPWRALLRARELRDD